VAAVDEFGSLCGMATSHGQHERKCMKRVIWITSAGLLVLAALLGLFAITRPNPPAQELSEAQFVANMQSNLLGRIEIRYAAMAFQPSQIRGTFFQTDTAGQVLIERGIPSELPFRAEVHLTPELEVKLLARNNSSVVTLNPLVEKVTHWFRRSR
jgi:hypothetical protein